MKNLGYYNGKIDEIENMLIPMNDRACFFGDGVYDATYSRNHIIFTLEEHVDRFFRSAALLDISLGIKKAELCALLRELTARVDSDCCFIYWQATRGTGPRNHCFPEGEKGANLWITVTPKEIVDTYKKVRLITEEDTRFLHCNIKTINLLPAVMASEKARRCGCDEVVFHRKGRVTECAHSNVHIIKDGCFITAPADELILEGIARRHLISACHRLGIPVMEKEYYLDELFDADEILISSAGSLGLAAEELDGKKVGGKAPELLRAVQQQVTEEFIRETTP